MYKTSVVTAVAPGAEAASLLEEIETLENRLHCMGEDGDCAYERAMSKLYRAMVEERKLRLSQLAAPQPA